MSLVPCFRRDDVWTPVFTPGLRHSGAGLVTTFYEIIKVPGFLFYRSNGQAEGNLEFSPSSPITGPGRAVPHVVAALLAAERRKRWREEGRLKKEEGRSSFFIVKRSSRFLAKRSIFYSEAVYIRRKAKYIATFFALWHKRSHVHPALFRKIHSPGP